MVSDTMRQREKSLIMSTYGRYPLEIVRGHGARLWDAKGREYIDLLAGISVCNLGHCHPEITEAVARQMGKLVHVSNLFFQQEQLDLAEELLETCSLERVFFCNSGAEANEGAIKLARRYMRAVQGREAYEIVTLSGSFHGRTLATLTATGQDKVKDGFEPLPAGFATVPFDDPDALEQAVGPKTAAVLVEVIQGEGGVREPSPGYLSAVQDLCRRKDVLFMIDEVQTGLCRTGRFWAHQRFDLQPDVMTSSKSLANGLPMGAVLSTAEVARGFEPGSHATTFGGGPLLSVAARKTLEIMRRDGLAARAEDVGRQAKADLDDVRRKYPDLIARVRGQGLMMGVELTFPGRQVWESLLMEEGFILNLTQDRILRLLPPLVIAQEDLGAFAHALDKVLARHGGEREKAE